MAAPLSPTLAPQDTLFCPTPHLLKQNSSKLMSEGVDVERLAACTIKYYKRLTHPKTILNYFRDGDWKIWYEDEEASGLLPNRQDINL
jgi:hypothetical protein